MLAKHTCLVVIYIENGI